MWKQGHACSVRLFPHPYGQQVHRLFLAMDFVRNRELLAAFGAASCEYAATVSGLHAFAESMFVLSFSVVRLECSFHCAMLFFVSYWQNGCVGRSAMCLVQKPRGVIHGITYSLRVANLGIVFLTAKVWLLISQ